ncbi:methylglutaconyl-CoA hydratase [Crenobacter luteus]|uniref:enoyl-CoA hydratase/isomerase family protein n=1 Tax=Crenobacter luteus TaxID=1452487 RepID=UPI0010439FBC|nr:enoyl-CoA hydratase/isomerase family protein [Crenobacter luteus]TCP14528.1 methylglutaconyl-CoA hydratase [Crenobacter luteus]
MNPVIEIDVAPPLATVWLNRPDKHNAFEETLIAALSDALAGLAARDEVRVLMLAGRGPSFCAGGDLNWMKKSAAYGEAENLADARALAALMQALHDFPKPVIGLVHGAAYGGGVGLAACCDVVVASETARFCLSEVKLGLIPSVIAPYVIEKIGASAARRYFLGAEAFSAVTAREIGLVHEVVDELEVATTATRLAELFARNGPQAMRAAKTLIRDVAGRPIDDALVEDTAQRIARIRVGAEGQEGLAAFLEKRAPRWR